MPTNFRLAYNSGAGYVDLFPRTLVEAIENETGAYEITALQVTIPAVNTMTQTITISTTPKMVNSSVRMILNSTGEQAVNDYSTITQFQVDTNQLIITRLYSMPTNSIEVTLLFFEKQGGGS